jgi:hypothetical protein
MTKLVFMYIAFTLIIIIGTSIIVNYTSKLNIINDEKEAFIPIASDFDYDITYDVLPLSQVDSRMVSKRDTRQQCIDLCSGDDDCTAFTYDTLSKDCQLISDPNMGFKTNNNGSLSTIGGLKKRATLQPVEKYYKKSNVEVKKGELKSSYNKVGGLHNCRSKCINENLASCKAFTYDFNEQTCNVYSEIESTAAAKNSDAYIIVR